MSRQSSKQLSNVKGLGATKVTSLLDAFSKPFLVRGLKRETPEEPTIAISEAALSRKASETNAHAAQEPDEQAEEAGSPEWPDEDADRENDGRNAIGPSRSPGLSPEPERSVWRDPLDDDAEDGVDEEEGPAKRARVT